MQELREEVGRIVGLENVVAEVNVPEEHTAAYFHDGNLHMPSFVVLPGSVDELSKIMQSANTHGVNIVPWGGGTNRATGSIVAPEGSLVVCMQRMNKILEVDEFNQIATVQAGIAIETLNRELRKRNLWWPHDPESKVNATVGGSVAIDGIGTYYCKFGSARDMVSAVKVVLPGGRVITAGRRVSHSAVGYDILRVLTGSEGTLGIIAEVTLRIDRIPEKREYAVVLFENVEQASKACTLLLDGGLRPEAFFIDDKVRFCHTIANIDPNLKEGAEAAFGAKEAAVIFSFSGSQNFVDFCISEALKMLVKEGGEKLGNDKAGHAWWRARSGILKTEVDFKSAAGAEKSAQRVFGSADACIPMEALPLWQQESEELARKYNLVSGGVGAYIGVNHDMVMEEKVFFDKTDPTEVARFLDWVRDLSKLAVDVGGTIAGTQGVGTKHLDMVDYEMGDTNDIAKALKLIFDPKDIMNRGKKLK